MPIRILDVSPNISPALREGKLAHRREVAGPGVDLDVVSLRRGPISLEATIEALQAGPGIIERVVEAEGEGLDGVLIDCFVDPALRPSREAANIPVMGAGLGAMLLAMAVGDKFSIITVKNALPGTREMVRAYCFQERVASIRAVEFSAFELYRNEGPVMDRITEIAQRAIEEDGADTIVLGCTAMSKLARSITQRLGVPVIDPAGAGLKLLTAVIELGISQSKRAYPNPPDRLAQMKETGLPTAEEARQADPA